MRECNAQVVRDVGAGQATTLASFPSLVAAAATPVAPWHAAAHAR
jgi:hypothetical protein